MIDLKRYYKIIQNNQSINILSTCGFRILLSLIILASFFGCESSSPELSIITTSSRNPVFTYGLEKLQTALSENAVTYEIFNNVEEASGATILLIGNYSKKDSIHGVAMPAAVHLPTENEAFSIFRSKIDKKPAWVISGYDDRGLLYGLLEVVRQIKQSAKEKDPIETLSEISASPYVNTRAISFYAMNRAYWESRFYNEEYWKKYFDLLIRNRFNTVKLIFGYENGGFLAPSYPYFFDVKDFPEIRMQGITPELQVKNLTALNRLIDLAHQRGLNFYVAIWDHIYRGGVQDGGLTKEEIANQSPFQVTGVTAQNLGDYTKAALTEFLSKVPELDGIQFRMHAESGLKEGNEMLAFWTDVFGMIKDVNPDFKVELRAKDLPESIIKLAIDQELNFTLTTKYWMEQMGLPFHPTHINRENQFDRRHGYADMLRYPKDYTIQWRMWTGGTQRILIWGDPEYGRRFAESTHLYNSDGFEVNEPLATKMETQPHDAVPFNLLTPDYVYYDYEFERYWHFFQTFGLMGYDPETSQQYWDHEFQERFGEAAFIVEKAVHKASWILPTIVAACSPYGTFPTTRGWPERQMYGTLPVYAKAEGSDIQQFASFDQEAEVLLGRLETAKQLPSETSRWFRNLHDEIQDLISEAEQLSAGDESKELMSTLTDLDILSKLALYHSWRIPAAVSYRIFVRTQNPNALNDAIQYEKMALNSWKEIVEAAGEVYSNDLMMGIRASEFMEVDHHMAGHWKDEIPFIEKGLEELKTMKNKFSENDYQQLVAVYHPDSGIIDQKRFNIRHDPVLVSPINQPISISAEVSTERGVRWMRVRYRAVNQHQDYRSIQMEEMGDKGSYTVTIPASEIDPGFDFMYFIEVMDNAGNGTIYPFLSEKTPYYVTVLQRENGPD